MAKFDAAYFLYLNPQLNSNLTSAEAFSYYSTQSNLVLYADPQFVSTSFDPEVYIEQHRDIANVSLLASLIPYEEEARFVRNLNVPSRLTSKNLFLVLSSTRKLTPNSINVGDVLRIKKCVFSVAEATVTWVDYAAGLVRVSNPRFDFVDLGSTYTLEGIRVPDARRIATINYLSNVNFAEGKQTGLFNRELYALLYPDARCKTARDAYLDMLSHGNRISSVFDLNTTKSLTITEPLSFFGHTIDRMRTTSEATTDLCEKTALMTEYSIKSYVDSQKGYFANEVTFGGRANFGGQADFISGASFSGLQSISFGIGECCCFQPKNHRTPQQCSNVVFNPWSNSLPFSNNNNNSNKNLFLVDSLPDLLFAGRILAGPPTSNFSTAALDVNGQTIMRGPLSCASSISCAAVEIETTAKVSGQLSLGSLQVSKLSTFDGPSSFFGGVSTDRIGIGSSLLQHDDPPFDSMVARFKRIDPPVTMAKVVEAFPGVDAWDVFAGVLHEALLG